MRKAYDSYHSTECGLVYPLKGDPTVEPSHDLAVRCFVLLTNAMGLDRYCEAVRTYGGGSRFDTGEDLVGRLTDGFHAIYALDGNETKRTVSNMFFMHCTASMMVSLLLLNGHRVPTDLLGTVGESLVHLLCAVNSNAYATAEPLKHVGGDGKSNPADIDVFSPLQHTAAAVHTVALVLCPAYSLVNHSCDPNIIVQTYDGVEVTRAVQPISKGSQVNNVYFIHCTYARPIGFHDIY